MGMASGKIEAFLAGKVFAVVGASQDRGKYGNKVLRAYLQDGRPASPVNPHTRKGEGVSSCPALASLRDEVNGVSNITPPAVRENVLDQAGALGIRRLWMQPGAESPAAVERAEQA